MSQRCINLLGFEKYERILKELKSYLNVNNCEENIYKYYFFFQEE